jgi:hypothetical protein
MKTRRGQLIWCVLATLLLAWLVGPLVHASSHAHPASLCEHPNDLPGAALRSAADVDAHPACPLCATGRATVACIRDAGILIVALLHCGAACGLPDLPLSCADRDSSPARAPPVC